MTTGSATGDRSERWRRSYRRVRKDALRSSDATNRRRLEHLGAAELPRSGRWLDVGAGDGNLVATLGGMGIRDVVALEPQVELLACSDEGTWRVAGSALDLPIVRSSVEVAVVMDVLHHLPPDRLADALAELHRVLRPGGHLLVCEPAATRTREVLTAALMSPLGPVTRFSRDKRQMVVDERDTLEPWLDVEPRFAALAGRAGFGLEATRRGLLHVHLRLRREAIARPATHPNP